MQKYRLNKELGKLFERFAQRLRYTAVKVGKDEWAFDRDLAEIIRSIEKVKPWGGSPLPWMPEEELRRLFTNYYARTGNLAGLREMAHAVIQWRKRNGLPSPGWVQDVYNYYDSMVESH